MKNLLPLALVISASFCSQVVLAQDPAAAPAPAPAAAAPAPAEVAPAAKTIDPAKVAEIRKLLEVTDTLKLTKQALQQMLSGYKSHFPDAPAGFWERMEKEINLDSLVDQVIPVYDKYYTLDDLKAVNAFYETPAGKHMVEASPQIMGESMQIAQAWGQSVGQKIQEELAKAKAAAPAPAADAPATAPAPAPATPPPAPASSDAK